MLQLIAFSTLNGVLYGMLLFMMASGLTLIFSMMGVLNFAHASFYMLGAYFGFEISRRIGFWPGFVVAPLLVGAIGALVERYGLRRAHRFGHVAELLFTFGLAFVIEELVQMFWGRLPVDYRVPPSLDFVAFRLFDTTYPAYRMFMLLTAIAMFVFLLAVLTRTRVGLIIQAALTHPNMVAMLGHDVPRIFMVVFGVGAALAGLAGVIAGPALVTQPSMAASLGPILFVVIVVGGLGSLTGAFVASLLIGLVQTFAVAMNYSFAEVLRLERAAVSRRSVAGDDRPARAGHSLHPAGSDPDLPSHRPDGNARNMTASLRAISPWLALALAVAAAPRIFSSGIALTMMSLMGVMIIFALSYNMLLGQTGLLSFGHAVYYGLGGFVAIHAMNAVIRARLGVPVPVIPLVGGLAGLGFGVLFGLVSTKRAGIDFLDDLARPRRTRFLELVHPAHLLRRRGRDHHQSHQADAVLRAQVRTADRGLLSHRGLVLRLHRWRCTPLRARLSGACATRCATIPSAPNSSAIRRGCVRFIAFCLSAFFAGVGGRPGGDQFRDHERASARRAAVGHRAADDLCRRRGALRRPDHRRGDHHLLADHAFATSPTRGSCISA